MKSPLSDFICPLLACRSTATLEYQHRICPLPLSGCLWQGLWLRIRLWGKSCRIWEICRDWMLSLEHFHWRELRGVGEANIVAKLSLQA